MAAALSLAPSASCFVPEALMKSHKWSIPQRQQYLSQAEEPKRQLLVFTHFISWLPGRGTEIMIIKWCNTRHTMRNIIIYHRRLMVLIEYNKNQASTDNSFYIARILPLVIGRILFRYLVYIKPFCDALLPQLQLAQSSLNAYYLFASKDAINNYTYYRRIYPHPFQV
jgi:hypothetical protein